MVKSHDSVKDNQNRVALQYGPLVYCLEGKDNRENAWNMLMTNDPRFEVKFDKGFLGGVNIINFKANKIVPSADGKSVAALEAGFTAIPYFSWNNRGPGEMQVWLPQIIEDVKINYGR